MEHLEVKLSGALDLYSLGHAEVRRTCGVYLPSGLMGDSDFMVECHQFVPDALLLCDGSAPGVSLDSALVIPGLVESVSYAGEGITHDLLVVYELN